jgi:hypothetical protein
VPHRGGEQDARDAHFENVVIAAETTTDATDDAIRTNPTAVYGK